MGLELIGITEIPGWNQLQESELFKKFENREGK